MTLLAMLEYLNDALFVGLAGVCYIRWRRQGGRAAAWLAVTFGALGGVVLAGLVLSASSTGEPAQWIGKLLLAALILFPYLLFRFTDSLDRAARRTEATVGVLVGTVLVWTLLLPGFPSPGQARPAWLSAYLVAVLLEWTIVSLIVALKLWRAGRGQPTAARRRMRGLSLAATSLNLAVVVSGIEPSTHPRPLAVATHVLTLSSALLFYLAFAPPAMLRNAWRRSEQETLRRAMGELKAVTRAEDVAACLLPHVMSMVGGRGAALVDETGRIIGSSGQTPGLQDRVTATDAGGPGAEAQVPGSVRLPLAMGALLAWASPFAPLFGREELELLRALASLAELALERVRTAERDSELAAVVDASGDAIVSTSLDGTIRSWNPAAEATYGHSAGEVVGLPLSIIVPPDRPDDLPDLLQRVGQGERVSLETQHLRQDGVDLGVALTAAPLRNRAAVVVGMSVVARDISERKQGERVLQEAKEAADRANQAKSEYLSRMSHELRTPLNAILGFAQLLEMEELTREQRENVHYVLSAARHLLALINEVLDIAAIEAGRLPLSLEPVAVADVVQEAVDLIRPLADQRGVLLSRNLAGSCAAHVHADRQRLKQVLLNLLSNAVKYNRAGGSVHLACERAQGERLQVKVTDTGPGIAPESLERLFVPFERLTNEQSLIEGTGLGLPLSLRLAEAMGGTLALTTTVGQGSTFWVELRVVEGPVERAGRERQAGRPPEPDQLVENGPTLTVLYIEDNLSNLELVDRVLSRRRGVKLISAMRPQLGLDLAGEHHPDLVLLDLHLPDMPGEEVLRRLRSGPKTASIPVVILSADARPALIAQLLDAGARAFLTKPLDVKELLRLVEAVAAEQERSSSPSLSP
ncbi:MAG TPA: ATP-binding protein [Actinomycetes bacterium]|nr:ATP-binding protein [Actinomycetes bacterium]